LLFGPKSPTQYSHNHQHLSQDKSKPDPSKFKVFSPNDTRKIVILQSLQRLKWIYDQLDFSQTAPVEAQERELEEFCPNKLQSERQ
ncbi:hypothetical protein ACH5RR_022916, partial [Cinchona calisaya]